MNPSQIFNVFQFSEAGSYLCKTCFGVIAKTFRTSATALTSSLRAFSSSLHHLLQRLHVNTRRDRGIGLKEVDVQMAASER